MKTCDGCGIEREKDKSHKTWWSLSGWGPDKLSGSYCGACFDWLYDRYYQTNRSKQGKNR